MNVGELRELLWAHDSGTPVVFHDGFRDHPIWAEALISTEVHGFIIVVRTED